MAHQAKLTQQERAQHFSAMQKHADADYAAGRTWTCACASCIIACQQGWKPKQERKPLALPFSERGSAKVPVIAWTLGIAFFMILISSICDALGVR